MDSPPGHSLGRLLGAVIVGIIALAGSGLFAIQYHQQRSAAAMAQVLEASGVLDLARSAQVDFKLQVQEWKNLLLRSRDDQALQAHLATFSSQQTVVERELGALATAPGLSEAMRAEAEALVAEHQRLDELYRTALQAYVPADARSVFAVDAAVRGIDRELNRRLDALAEAILQHLRTQAAALRDQSAQEYETLRMVVSGVAAVVIALAAALAWRAARPPAASRVRA